jgi:histidyl-tRNA synthetase
MPSYREKLVGYLKGVEEKLCEDCNRRIATNPIRTLDCKNESCQAELADAPKLLDNLCEDCANDFATLQTLLRQSGIDFEVDTHLVRGLDYYTKTAFEFISDQVGAQSAIAGGGRYDRLVEFLGGKPTPAVGFALGIERIMELVSPIEPENEGYYIGILTPDAAAAAFALASRLRKKAPVHLEYASKGFKSHMKGVDKSGARYALLIGQKELEEDSVWMKDIRTQEEKTVSQEAL